jgi:putative transposase
MPSRNIVKMQSPESFYHVYFRGSSKQNVFLDSADYVYFLKLFERYLSKKQARSKDGVPYPNFRESIELSCYCLMTNHVHLLVYQKDANAMGNFMKSVISSYTRYFNLKYKRTGKLFESTYKASLIDKNNYLQHISRYIHLNPRKWENYRQSSLKFYLNGDEPEWLRTDSILSMFADREDYYEFVANYEEMRDMLAEMKYQLADQ